MYTSPNHISERIPALDAMRGVMMLLGIVLHASLTYGRIDYGASWPLKDPSNNFLFDIIVAFIHAFRMSIFFIAGGFFAALLFYHKGPKAMLINRIKRILIPLVVAVLILSPLTLIAFAYAKSAFDIQYTPLANLMNNRGFGKFIPFQLMHL